MIVAVRSLDPEGATALLTYADGTVSSSAIPPNAGDVRADYEAWLTSGGVLEPYVPPAPEPKTFIASDLVDQITPDDLEAIEAAVASDANLRLLWVRLTARGGDRPVSIESEAFQTGWAALAQAIGPERANTIAAAIGIT